MAGFEAVVATYELHDVSRRRLEVSIHRVLDDVRFDVEIPDRIGTMVRPREWFMVQLSAIDEIVRRIGDGTLSGMTYDRNTASLVNGG